jgi:hypothetical protein
MLVPSVGDGHSNYWKALQYLLYLQSHVPAFVALRTARMQKVGEGIQASNKFASILMQLMVSSHISIGHIQRKQLTMKWMQVIVYITKVRWRFCKRK